MNIPNKTRKLGSIIIKWVPMTNPMDYTLTLATVIKHVKLIAKTRHAVAITKHYNNCTNAPAHINRLRREFRSLIDERTYGQYRLSYPKYNLSVCYRTDSIEGRRDSLAELRSEIKNYREGMRHLETNRTSSGFDRIGKVHLVSNDIVNLYARRALDTPKRPKNDATRYVGVEIECNVPDNVDMRAFLSLAKILNVGSDGSIVSPDGFRGIELRILTTENAYKSDMRKVAEVLHTVGARVNRSCGLHVHLDQRGLTREVITQRYNNLVRYQRWLFAMVSPSRRSNQYCKRTRQSDPYQMHSRYHAINGCSLHEHSTIEVRLHQSTTDAVKIINWIELLLKIQSATPVLRVASTLKGIKTQIGISEDLLAYVSARVSHFGDPNYSETTENSEMGVTSNV